jgi:dCTP deaminase
MTILNWKDTLTRILAGFIYLPDIDKPSRDELNSLLAKLKSEEHPDLKEYREVIHQNKKIIETLEHNEKKLSSIDQLVRKLDDSFEKLGTDKKVQKDFEEQDLSLFPVIISDFNVECLDPANYNLRLGNEVYVTTARLPQKLTETNNTVAIKPGEFGILLTHEYIYVPQNLMGLISLRFRYKQLGLINISGFHVDPGFRGRLVFAVYNAGPNNIVLRHKEPVFMIMLEKLEKPIKEPYKFAYGRRFAGMEHIPTDIVTSLGGPSVSVLRLDRRIRSLETQIRIIEGLIISLIGLVLAFLLTIRAH